MSDRPFNVPFPCTGNSARGILAEAILQREGMGRFNAYGAGGQPTGIVNLHAIDLLKNLNHATDGLRSRSRDEFAGPDAPELDFVFTVRDNAANEVCPVWPGQPMSAHRGVPDPAAAERADAETAAFAETCRMLTNRISIFVNLPLNSIGKQTLQQRLHDIGAERFGDAP